MSLQRVKVECLNRQTAPGRWCWDRMLHWLLADFRLCAHRKAYSEVELQYDHQRYGGKESCHRCTPPQGFPSSPVIMPWRHIRHAYNLIFSYKSLGLFQSTVNQNTCVVVLPVWRLSLWDKSSPHPQEYDWSKQTWSIKNVDTDLSLSRLIYETA